MARVEVRPVAAAFSRADPDAAAAAVVAGEEDVAVADNKSIRPKWLLLTIDGLLCLLAYLIPLAWGAAFLATLFGVGLPRPFSFVIFLVLLVVNFKVIGAQWKSGENLHESGHCAKCNAGCGGCGGKQ